MIPERRFDIETFMRPLFGVFLLCAFCACDSDRSSGGGGVQVVGAIDTGIPGGGGNDGAVVVRDSGPNEGGVVDPDAGPFPDATQPGDASEDQDATGGDANSPGGDGGGGGADGGPFDQNGCLTFEGASQICGFNSDEAVCNFALSCELSSSLSQCKINCEMGTAVRCYTQADVLCIAQAFQAESCSALSACEWIF